MREKTEEIEGIKKFFLFYYLNKYFIKKTINKLVSKKIQNVVLKLISSNPNSICDVACGDDNLILKLEKIYNPEICVANDISWKILSLIRKNNKESKVIFTNHDVLDLPFKKKFDLIILKNTLHHIPKEEQINLIQKLSDLSKQLIIIDVEDPYRSSFLTKLWHWYYVYFLGDKGKFFLNLEEFKEIINTKIKNKNVLIGIINTMKGKYFYASLLDKNQQEEVEIKVRVEKSQINSIKDQLKKEKALFVEKVKEKDSYFTSFYRDFIKTKECLRLRERANFLELTYKGPTTNLMRNKKQFWKKEINIPLNFSNKNDVENLLVLLGFKKIVEVIKEREEFILNKQKITIDKVENAGWFIEIENTIIDEKEREKALNDNLKLLNKLGIDSSNIVEEPYRDLVLKKIS